MHLIDRQLFYTQLRKRVGFRMHKNEAGWMATKQPTLYLAARRLHTKTSFFKMVAKVCGLPYTDTLPIRIFEKDSLVQKVGLEAASKYLFFPYYENKKLFVAVSDPYQWQEIQQICQEKLGCSEISFVVTEPFRIWSALNHASYIPSQEVAESHLHIQYPQYSGKERSHLFLKAVLVGCVGLGLGGLLFSPHTMVLVVLVTLNSLYLILNPLRLILSLGAFRIQKEDSNQKIKGAVPDHTLPVYTLLIPLKEEKTVVPQLIQSLQQLDYPPEKLDIKFVVEVTDTTTLKALEDAGLSVHETSPSSSYELHQVVKVPVGELSTKPRSCNYALQFARGELVVIYDAEDQPDPLQLRKAYYAFLNSHLNTICVQAKLNYYNTNQNIMTRCFTAEYSYWFDILLPALAHWRIPLPLGGTSNHFQTKALKTIGTWDPYNVTEDAELGWRLSRLGYQTTMMDSYTLEEANSETLNWIRQRTRWQKGFLMTLLVHLRHPIQLVRDLGIRGAVVSTVVFASTVVLPIINLWLWIHSLCWLLSEQLGLVTVFTTLPVWITTITLANLIFGNVLYIALHAIGLIYTKQWPLLWILPFLPLYWLLQSISGYRSLWQITKQPHLWEKTKHGLAIA